MSKPPNILPYAVPGEDRGGLAPFVRLVAVAFRVLGGVFLVIGSLAIAGCGIAELWEGLSRRSLGASMGDPFSGGLASIVAGVVGSVCGIRLVAKEYAPDDEDRLGE